MFQISSLFVGSTYGSNSDQQVSYKSPATEQQTALVVEDYTDAREQLEIGARLAILRFWRLMIWSGVHLAPRKVLDQPFYGWVNRLLFIN